MSSAKPQLFFRSFLFTSAFLLILVTESRAQGFSSPISWHHNIFDTRVSALGQSMAVLQNGSAYHINPAVPFKSGVIHASGSRFSASNSFSTNPPTRTLYSPAIGYSNGNFSYLVMLDQTSVSVPGSQGFEDVDFSNTLLRF